MITKLFGTTPIFDIVFGNVDMPILTKHVKILQKYKNNEEFFLDYTIKNGERLDQIAKRIYGNEDRWYIIALFNDIYDINEQMPLDDNEFNEMLVSKYPFNDVDDVAYYTNQAGIRVDPVAIYIETGELPLNVVASKNLKAVTIYENEILINNNKRQIKILDPDLVAQLEDDIARLLENE